MRPDGKIEKPEDREWKQWYERLDTKEHEKKLAMLGLGKEDIDEWEHHTVFKDIEQEVDAGNEETKLNKKKKTK